MRGGVSTHVCVGVLVSDVCRCVSESMLVCVSVRVCVCESSVCVCVHVCISGGDLTLGHSRLTLPGIPSAASGCDRLFVSSGPARPHAKEPGLLACGFCPLSSGSWAGSWPGWGPPCFTCAGTWGPSGFFPFPSWKHSTISHRCPDPGVGLFLGHPPTPPSPVSLSLTTHFPSFSPGLSHTTLENIWTQFAKSNLTY